MKLNEKFYTRTKDGLTKCDGKRIDSDYAVIHPWFTKKKRIYYVIHIKSGLKVGENYLTIEDCISNFEKDLNNTKKHLKEKGMDFNKQIEIGIKLFNEAMEEELFYEEKDEEE